MTRTSSLLNAALLGSCLAVGSPVLAQQTPAQTFSDLNLPSAEVTPHPEYVRALARKA